MKTITTLFALVFLFGAFKPLAQSFHIPQDKIKHFAVGAFIAGSTQLLAYKITDNRGKAMLIGFGAGCVAGLAKELYDMTGRGTPSIKDVMWTAAGAGVANLSIRYTIQTKHHHRDEVKL